MKWSRGGCACNGSSSAIGGVVVGIAVVVCDDGRYGGEDDGGVR